MRKLIITEFVSLDGVMEAPGGEAGYAHAGWVGPFYTPELGAFKDEEMEEPETLVLGRTTYESFAGAWPDRDGPYADKLNAMEKILVSTTVTEPGWNNVTVIRDLEPIAKLKEDDGAPLIVHGSRTLAHALLAAGLVDEINLQVFPIVLGSGARLYPDSPDTLGLELLEARPTPSGVVVQRYAVKR